MSVTAEAHPPRVRFGLRPNRGLLLGLSTIRVVALGAAAVLLVAGLAGGKKRPSQRARAGQSAWTRSTKDCHRSPSAVV